METELTRMDYLLCGFMFALGEALYLFWVKFPSFKEKAQSFNKPFSYAEWWDCDKNLMIGLNLLPVTLFIGLDQLLHFRPEAISYLRWMFWALGFTGSTIGFKYLSNFAKGQLTLSSIKSNIADILNGSPIVTVKDAIEKGKELTGQDVTTNPKINEKEN